MASSWMIFTAGDVLGSGTEIIEIGALNFPMAAWLYLMFVRTELGSNDLLNQPNDRSTSGEFSPTTRIFP